MGQFRIAYLHLRGRTFYFRRIVAHVESNATFELKVSLRTSDIREAKRRCSALTAAIDSLLYEINADMSQITRTKIERVAREALQAMLDTSEESAYLLRKEGGPHLRQEIANAKRHLQELESAVKANQVPDQIAAQVQRIYRDELGGEGKLSKGSETFYNLSQAFIRAWIEHNKMYVPMLEGKGHEIGVSDTMFKDMSLRGMPDVRDDGTLIPIDITFEKAAAKFIAAKSLHEWTPRTIRENERLLRWFGELGHANRALKTISKADVKAFRDILLNLPPHLTKLYPNATFAEMVKVRGEGTIAPNTIERYFGVLKSFFKWALNDDLIAINPVPIGAVLSRKARRSDKRAFTREELQGLFDSPLYRGCRSGSRRSKPGEIVIRDDKFWIPLVALFTGMRLGEIVMLTVADIKEGKGFWYIDINRISQGEVKEVKSEAGVRDIPIHSFLVEIGFLDYVAHRRKSGMKGRVFSDTKIGKNGEAADPFSKFFSRYLHLIRLKCVEVSFHSFRHNATDALKAARVADSHVKAIIGHDESSVTYSVYASPFTPEELIDDVNLMSYGLDLTHLGARNGKPKLKTSRRSNTT